MGSLKATKDAVAFRLPIPQTFHSGPPADRLTVIARRGQESLQATVFFVAWRLS